MANLIGNSSDIAVAAVKGTNTSSTGAGVEGDSNTGWGVYGHSINGRGVVARSESNYGLRAHSTKSAGMRSSSDEGRGAEGWSIKSEGVVGISTNGTGVWGQAEGAGNGVLGTRKTGPGVWGESEGPGVVGVSKSWIGVYGETTGIENGPAGVWGEHKGAGIGVKAVSKDGVGIAAYSNANEAVHAETKSSGTAAIAAYNNNAKGTGAAIFAKKEGSKGHAGFFVGDVFVTGTLGVQGDIILANADFAEDFTVTEQTEPGEVMVLTEDGTLTQSTKVYDKKVVGVLSGAGNYKPGIILDKQNNDANRKPIAMMGKVFCKVDADASPIETGDMLTTSNIPGYAMKAIDPLKAFGAVIGKALASLSEGRGLIPILVTLQ